MARRRPKELSIATMSIHVLPWIHVLKDSLKNEMEEKMAVETSWTVRIEYTLRTKAWRMSIVASATEVLYLKSSGSCVIRC